MKHSFNAGCANQELLKTLSSALLEIASGNFDYRLPVRTESEITNALGTAFNLTAEELEQKTSQLQNALAKNEHLNRLLHTIRNINQLIVQEKNPHQLIQRTCQYLVEAKSYLRAWIMFTAISTKNPVIAHQGYDEDFWFMENQLKRGVLPPCCERALQQDQPIIIENTVVTCATCPLADQNPSGMAMTAKLAIGKNNYGFLNVSMPSAVNFNDEEYALFQEVAGDMSFAFHQIAIEEERNHLEDELIFKNTLLEAQNEAAIEGILIVDPQDRVISYNERFAKLWNIPQTLLDTKDDDQILAHILSQLKNPGKYLSQVTHLYAHRKMKSRDEVVCLNERIFDRYSAPVIDNCGIYHGRVWFFRDISEQKQLQQLLEEAAVEAEERAAELSQALDDLRSAHSELKETQGKLVQEQKLKAIGQLAAGIAHEINTPIQYIGDNVTFLEQSYIRLLTLLEHCQETLGLAKDGPLTADQIKETEEMIQKIKPDFIKKHIPRAIEQSLEGVQRVANIVKAMKEFSHPSKGEKETINIHQAIETTITIARNEWKYVAEVNVHFDSALPLVPCYPDEFNQVILNLLVNAAQAIGEATDSGSQGKGTITVMTTLQDNWAEIRVSDTGPGIPAEIRNRIFEPFFTTKEVGKGTGQGLAIAYSIIVEKHKGTIQFESSPGEGTTFIIRLPLEDSLAVL